MKLTDFTLTQKRALAITTIIAIMFGAYFLRDYFILIVVAAISAVLFSPLYTRFKKHFKPTMAAVLTLLIALLVVIIPTAIIIALAIFQITHELAHFTNSLGSMSINEIGDSFITFVNDMIGRIPFVNYQLTESSLADTLISVGKAIGNSLLNFLVSAVPNVFGLITASIIYLYVFISLLVNQEKLLTIFRQLNPLGDEISDMYLAKTAAMIKGVVKGQFIIAVCQGTMGAISIYIAGFHDAFFIFAILLSAMSIIPLGSGIITIPLGLAFMMFGNVFGGLFIILWHVIVITNMDNVLRPILVPKEAKLDPALMLLAVFAGISMFGFWGLAIGPVIMILIVTTIKVYLTVYRNMTFEAEPVKKFKKIRA